MLYEKALATKQKALTLDAQGNWREALNVLSQVKEVERLAFNGKDDEPHVPQILHNIGVAYAKKSEFLKAIDAYRSSLDLQRKLTGDMNAGVASALMNLGNAFQEVDPPRLDRSQFLYERALEIQRVVLDSMNPLIADTLHQLGLTHEKQAGRRERRPSGMMIHINDREERNKHHTQARAMYWECLHIREPVLGDHHVDTTATLFNLGLSLRNSCIFRRALWMPFKFKRKSLELSRCLLRRALNSMEASPNNFDLENVAACQQYLATVELEFEQWDVAMELFIQDFNILTKLFQPGRKYWLAQRNGIDVTSKEGLLGEALCGRAMCLVRLNKLPEALEVYGEARKRLRALRVVDEAATQVGWGGGIAAKVAAMKIKAKVKRKMGLQGGSGGSDLGNTTADNMIKRDVGPRIMDLLEMAERCYTVTLRRINQLKKREADKVEEANAEAKEARRLRLLRGGVGAAVLTKK